MTFMDDNNYGYKIYGCWNFTNDDICGWQHLRIWDLWMVTFYRRRHLQSMKFTNNDIYVHGHLLTMMLTEGNVH